MIYIAPTLGKNRAGSLFMGWLGAVKADWNQWVVTLRLKAVMSLMTRNHEQRVV